MTVTTHPRTRRSAPPAPPGLDAAMQAHARRWGRDPALFADEVLGVDLWAQQREIARAVRDHARVAVRSCHAAGKTMVAAVCVCWFLYTRPGAVVLTTAPTFRQVRYVLWRSIQGLVAGARHPLGGSLLDTELRLGGRWYGLGLSTDNAERFQGFHAPHVLVVVDEPGAVPPDVFAGIEGVLASGRTRLLMIGNPTKPDGPFFDAFHSQAEAYRSFRISAFDTPNFQPGQPPRDYLVSPEWVRQRRALWGEGSNLYRSRVLAEFPRRASDSLFSRSALDAAAAADIEPAAAAPASPARAALGVDVARFGDDATAFSWIEDGRLVRQEERRGLSLMETAGRVVEALRARPGMAVAVDDTGLGGGVTDRLCEQAIAPLAVNFGATAEDAAHYVNRAAELYSRLAIAIEQGDLRIAPGLPTFDALAGQLSRRALLAGQRRSPPGAEARARRRSGGRPRRQPRPRRLAGPGLGRVRGRRAQPGDLLAHDATTAISGPCCWRTEPPHDHHATHRRPRRRSARAATGRAGCCSTAPTTGRSTRSIAATAGWAAVASSGARRSGRRPERPHRPRVGPCCGGRMGVVGDQGEGRATCRRHG